MPLLRFLYRILATKANSIPFMTRSITWPQAIHLLWATPPSSRNSRPASATWCDMAERSPVKSQTGYPKLRLRMICWRLGLTASISRHDTPWSSRCVRSTTTPNLWRIMAVEARVKSPTVSIPISFKDWPMRHPMPTLRSQARCSVRVLACPYPMYSN